MNIIIILTAMISTKYYIIITRAKVTRQIRIAKALYYGGKFSRAKDNRSKWTIIREIGTDRKCVKIYIDVDVNKLNDQFVNSKIRGFGMYFSGKIEYRWF